MRPSSGVSGSATDPVVVRAGEEVPFERLVAELDDIGYARTDRVESRGELAVRGGVIDVFPAQADDAVRIDFWGDYVEELRVFSIGSQRSMGAVDEMAAYPAREFRPDEKVRAAARTLASAEPWAASGWDRIAEGVRFAGMESWLPWLAPPRNFLDELPESGAVILLDPVQTLARAGGLVEEESDLAEALADTWGGGAFPRPAPAAPVPRPGRFPARPAPRVPVSCRQTGGPPHRGGRFGRRPRRPGGGGPGPDAVDSRRDRCGAGHGRSPGRSPGVEGPG